MKEGESGAKSSDGKSLTTRVTMAMIRCAFFQEHVEEDMIVEFGDEDDVENVEDEGPLRDGSARQRPSARSRKRPWSRKRC